MAAVKFVGRSLLLQASRIAGQTHAERATRLPHASLYTSTSTAVASGRTEMDYEELSDLLIFNDDVALIDVRTPNELQNYGSIPGAINIPLAEVKAALQLPNEEFHEAFYLRKPAKNAKTIVFYARGPNASSAAVEIAHRLGYKGSRQYTGGWEDYCQKTGLPLKKVQTATKQQRTPFMNPSYDTYKSFAF